MGKVLVTDTYLNDIADAIRNKNGSLNTYKPSEMAAAIENIQVSGGTSDNSTVSLKFTNPSPGTQKINIEVSPHAVKKNSDNLYTISKYPTVTFWPSVMYGYKAGTFDTPSPYTFMGDEKTINLSATELLVNEGELVDLSKWYYNAIHSSSVSPIDTVVTEGWYLYNWFTEAAMEYLTSIRPTSLYGWLAYEFERTSESVGPGEEAVPIEIPTDYSPVYCNPETGILDFTFLDTSECTNFDYALGGDIYNPGYDKEFSAIVINASNWDTRKAETMRGFCSISNFTNRQSSPVKLTIDCTNIDTSNATILDNFISLGYIDWGDVSGWEFKGTIDMASCNSYGGLVYSPERDHIFEYLTTPIKIKNPPSDSNWWEAAGFTSEDQFEIVT